MKKHPDSTSWQGVSKWYNDIVGEQGHHYHQTIIIPKSLALLQFPPENGSLLDLACGQGIMSRHIPTDIAYLGVDIATSLISFAKKQNKKPSCQFMQGDITKKLSLQSHFSHATIILAIQNIEHPSLVFKNASVHLLKGGSFLIVLNHPCFRIPRQSAWKIDTDNKMQYRRIDRYLSPMKIPIQTHPSKAEKSPETWSFHYPLSSYTGWLKEAGFTIELIEEWCSDKVSDGKMAKMENRSRQEIPLFMAILARKL
jgi:ubiquinone/menaquinone biosynthesis C-methylase UbiE